jgi:hypothetical protein
LHFAQQLAQLRIPSSKLLDFLLKAHQSLVPYLVKGNAEQPSNCLTGICTLWRSLPHGMILPGSGDIRRAWR